MTEVTTFGSALLLRGVEDATARSLPGARFNRGAGGWTVPATPAAAAALRESLEVDRWSPEAARVLRQAEAARETLEAVRDYDAAELEPLPWSDYKFPPWRHQLAAYHAAMTSPALLLFMGMGAGKTRTTFDVLRGREAKRTLIVAPKSVVDNWAEEGDKHAPDFEVRALSSGSVKRRAELARRALENPLGPLVIVINYESVWRPEFSKVVMSTAWDAIVCDEIQKIKSPGGKASRFMARTTPLAKFRLGLSGTPCPHGPLDAYGVFRFLDPGVFGTSYQRFKARYAILGGYQGRVVVDYQNRGEYNAKFYSITFRVDRDVLDLPPEQHLERTCKLPPDAARVYRGLRDELVAEIDSGEVVTAANALVRVLKLAQVASGTLKTDDGRLERIHLAKADVLAEVLDELDPAEPVVVFARFRGDLDTIHLVADRCGRASLELSGRRNELAEWKRGEAPILAVQIQAGGVGIDLTRACYCVYFSQTWSLGDYEQSLARVHRPGQSRPVTYVHLITAGTVDRTVYRALRTKRDAIEDVLRDPRKAL